MIISGICTNPRWHRSSITPAHVHSSFPETFQAAQGPRDARVFEKIEGPETSIPQETVLDEYQVVAVGPLDGRVQGLAVGPRGSSSTHTSSRRSRVLR